MKQEMKAVTVKLSEKDDLILCDNAKRRKLDKTNYIRYLILQDKNEDLRSETAAKALDKISFSAEEILRQGDDKAALPEIKKYIGRLEEGVKELWRCLK